MYNVQIVVKKDTLTAYIDKVHLATIQDSSVRSGGIGFATWKSTINAFNVRLTDLQGELLVGEVEGCVVLRVSGRSSDSLRACVCRQAIILLTTPMLGHCALEKRQPHFGCQGHVH